MTCNARGPCVPKPKCPAIKQATWQQEREGRCMPHHAPTPLASKKGLLSGRTSAFSSLKVTAKSEPAVRLGVRGRRPASSTPRRLLVRSIAENQREVICGS